jgi:hypothetical protein
VSTKGIESQAVKFASKNKGNSNDDALALALLISLPAMSILTCFIKTSLFKS